MTTEQLRELDSPIRTARWARSSTAGSTTAPATAFDADRARRDMLQRHGWSIFDLASNTTEAEVIAIATAA